jgi:hypothetical protein
MLLNFKRMQPRPEIPPWSRRKRWTVALGGSISVLVVSFLVGITVYRGGSWVGVFKSQSIKTLILEEMADNPALMEEAFTSPSTCPISKKWQLLWFDDRWQPTDTPSGCSTLSFLHPHAGLVTVHISTKALDKRSLVETSIAALTHVTQETFYHPLYEGLMVSGTNASSLEHRFYLLELLPHEWLEVSYLGGTPITHEAVEALVAGIRVDVL